MACSQGLEERTRNEIDAIPTKYIHENNGPVRRGLLSQKRITCTDMMLHFMSLPITFKLSLLLDNLWVVKDRVSPYGHRVLC